VLLTIIIAANQRDERSYHQGYSFGYDTGACSSIRGMWQLSSDRDQWDVDDMYDGCVAGAKDGGWR
jgi:hypothetical protein